MIKTLAQNRSGDGNHAYDIGLDENGDFAFSSGLDAYADIIADIKRRFNTDCGLFDMEIAAICQVAELYNNIPVVAVKYVSDVPEDGHSEHSYDAFADAHSDFTPLLLKLEEL